MNGKMLTRNMKARHGIRVNYGRKGRWLYNSLLAISMAMA